MATATLEFHAPLRANFNTSISGSSSQPSIADTLPTLNFGFDDLRNRMNAFTQRFDDFIEQGRRRVLEERNQFRMSVAQVQESQQTTTLALSSLHHKSTTHNSLLASQAHETTDLQRAIQSFTNIRDGHLTAIETVRTRLISTRAAVAAKRKDVKREEETRFELRRGDEGEVEMWERVLGMRVEGVGVEGRVRFIFEFGEEVDKAAKPETGREAWFELAMPEVSSSPSSGGNGSNGEYTIIASSPALSPSISEQCLRKMNDGVEDLAGFLKGMREIMRIRGTMD